MNSGKERVLELGEMTGRDLVCEIRGRVLAMRDRIDPKTDRRDKTLSYLQRAEVNVEFLNEVVRQNSALFNEYFRRTKFAVGISHDRTLRGSLTAIGMKIPLPTSQIVVDAEGICISPAVDHNYLITLTPGLLSEHWRREELVIKRFGDMTKRKILKKLADSV